MTSVSVLLLNRTPGTGGDLNFEPAKHAQLQLTGATGAYPLNFDSDGHIDLVVLRAGSNRFFRGGPDCEFPALQLQGLEGVERWTTSFSATWEGCMMLQIPPTDPPSPSEPSMQHASSSITPSSLGEPP